MGFRVAAEAVPRPRKDTPSSAKGVAVIREETLERCEGYNVLCPNGHLGFVDLVLHDENGEVSGLGVACGLFARRFAIVSLEDIARVDPSSRRLTLFDTPEPGPYEHIAEVLRARAHAGTQ
jgi:hypothetical protein